MILPFALPLFPKEYEDRYCALYAKIMEQMTSKKRLLVEIDDALVVRQKLAVANLLGKHGVAVSGGVASSPSTSYHSL